MKTTQAPTKRNVGIVFGGESAEHEISILSARSVLEAIDRNDFEPHLLGIDKRGHWHLIDSAGLLSDNSSLHSLIERHSLGRLHIAAGESGMDFTHTDLNIPSMDALFPVTHGPKGEDGTLQGLLEFMNIPYVGPGVLSSAVGMDKDVSKRLLREAGLPVVDHTTLRKQQLKTRDISRLTSTFGYPLFVKPANLGSSIGVTKVYTDEELLNAIRQGFQHDRKVIIEKAVVGEEIECAVMGNDEPVVSVPGRIVYQTDFYDYDAKYDESKGTTLEIPAKMPPKLGVRVQEMARRAYETLDCEGLARVDMFVTAEGDIYVNEVNTLPGFTKYSMYPKLWEATGLSYTELITKLIDYATTDNMKKQLPGARFG